MNKDTKPKSVLHSSLDTKKSMSYQKSEIEEIPEYQLDNKIIFSDR